MHSCKATALSWCRLELEIHTQFAEHCVLDDVRHGRLLPDVAGAGYMPAETATPTKVVDAQVEVEAPMVVLWRNKTTLVPHCPATRWFGAPLKSGRCFR
eukprot:3512498-Amphidinium_carterae.1